MSRWEGSILRNTFSSSNDVRLYWDEVCFKFITRTCGCITNTFHTNSNVAGHFSSVPRSHSLCLCVVFQRLYFHIKLSMNGFMFSDMYKKYSVYPSRVDGPGKSNWKLAYKTLNVILRLLPHALQRRYYMKNGTARSLKIVLYSIIAWLVLDEVFRTFLKWTISIWRY